MQSNFPQLLSNCNDDNNNNVHKNDDSHCNDNDNSNIMVI